MIKKELLDQAMRQFISDQVMTLPHIDRLTNQRQASPNTIASYRDTFRILFF